MSDLTARLHALIDSLPVAEDVRVELRRAITEYGAQQAATAMQIARKNERGNGHEPIHRRGD